MKRHIASLAKCLLLLLFFLIKVTVVAAQIKPIPPAHVTDGSYLYLADHATGNWQEQSVSPAYLFIPVPIHSTMHDITASVPGRDTQPGNRASTLGPEAGTERLELKIKKKALSSKKELSFRLRQNCHYRLEILNAQGMLLQVMAEGNGKAQETVAVVCKKDNYVAGNYIGRLITDDEVTSVRFAL